MPQEKNGILYGWPQSEPLGGNQNASSIPPSPPRKPHFCQNILLDLYICSCLRMIPVNFTENVEKGLSLMELPKDCLTKAKGFEI